MWKEGKEREREVGFQKGLFGERTVFDTYDYAKIQQPSPLSPLLYESHVEEVQGWFVSCVQACLGPEKGSVLLPKEYPSNPFSL